MIGDLARDLAQRFYQGQADLERSQLEFWSHCRISSKINLELPSSITIEYAPRLRDAAKNQMQLAACWSQAVPASADEEFTERLSWAVNEVHQQALSIMFYETRLALANMVVASLAELNKNVQGQYRLSSDLIIIADFIIDPYKNHPQSGDFEKFRKWLTDNSVNV
ncbi:hypothetical protein YOLOSWAG_63 [Erwinia phage vB_EamM_Yoloswag]|uniref:Uncharacterized protein n=1 Tax=Erwinia phage vB_EamM_Yoloswag TaxID=1958956 RepID=A0A1S6L2Z9_9CAUD|nr:hypothetical protein HOR66_gp063 [Erwinia phage vB_EamM_Yoloswag]AQT28546.1 hypothetical protein YOLOSWAG_63 [Erwinia phage vB_EamM_Yoloswag]